MTSSRKTAPPAMQVLYYVPFVLFGLTVLPFNALCFLSCVLPGRKKREPALRRWAARLMRLFDRGTRLAGLTDFRYRGLDTIGPPPRIFIANHTGLLDALLLFGAYPHFNCIYKQSLSRNPCFSHIPKAMGFIPNHPGSFMLQRALDQLRNGGNLLVFPEGTRGRYGEMGHFSPGFLSIARLSDAPMTPVLIENEGGIFAKKRGFFTPVPIPVVYRFTVLRDEFAASRHRPDLEESRRIEAWFREKLAGAGSGGPPPAPAASPGRNEGFSREKKLTVPIDAPYFRAHFPGHPIVPGAVLLGWMIDAVRAETGNRDGEIRATNVKFLNEVPPGTELSLHCRKTGDCWETELARNGQPVAKARILPS